MSYSNNLESFKIYYEFMNSGISVIRFWLFWSKLQTVLPSRALRSELRVYSGIETDGLCL